MKTKIISFSKGCDNFIKTPYAFIFFLGFIFLFSVLNYISFSMGMEISFPWSESNVITIDSSNSWVGWLEITIASVGALVTMFGVIWAVNLKKEFIYPTLVGETFVVIDSIIIGAVFTSVSYIFMMGISIISWKNWNKKNNDTDGKINLALIFIFLFFYFGIGLPISISLINEGNILNSFFDVVGSGIVVVAWYCILQKKKYGFLLFFITDFTYMIYFFSSGIWSTGSSYIIYALIDSTSFMSWNYKESQ